MKALPPAPSQLELLPRERSVLSVVEPSARPEILRTLAEILLAAASETARRREEQRDEAR
jgi:hypothetical protein